MLRLTEDLKGSDLRRANNALSKAGLTVRINRGRSRLDKAHELMQRGAFPVLDFPIETTVYGETGTHVVMLYWDNPRVFATCTCHAFQAGTKNCSHTLAAKMRAGIGVD